MDPSPSDAGFRPHPVVPSQQIPPATHIIQARFQFIHLRRSPEDLTATRAACRATSLQNIHVALRLGSRIQFPMNHTHGPRLTRSLLALFLVSAMAHAADFRPLFNGHDLAGWTNVNCAPETWSVRKGVIFCTGFPTGALRTERQYENFILELEWRHLSSGGNSGIFIWASPIAAPGVPFLRAIEVQVLDHGYNAPGKNEWYTTHGDVFPIHGSSMKPFGRHNGQRSFPSGDFSKGSPEWNHYRIVCDRGIIKLHVNGKEVSGGGDCSYAKGYIGLEAEGAPVEFRNLKIQELPGSASPADRTAPTDPGFLSLFTGLDLRGWHPGTPGTNGWQVQGEHLVANTTRNEPPQPLLTDRSFGELELIIDCRISKETDVSNPPVVQLAGGGTSPVSVPLLGTNAKGFSRFRINVQGDQIALMRGEEIVKTWSRDAQRVPGSIGLFVPQGSAEFMNLYIRDLGSRL